MTITDLRVPTSNAADLARFLRTYRLPGYQPVKKIRELRRERAERRGTPEPTTTPAERLAAKLSARWRTEIEARGGETEIVGQFETKVVAIVDRDRCTGLTLMHAEGWRAYGKRASWATLSYLCGHEDGQDWAVRVPGSITRVADAIDWLTPADVRNCRSLGKKVDRQGDVYAIETTKAHDGKGADELPDNHVWDAATRTLTHPQHGVRHLPHPVRFVRQRTYEMGRGGAWGAGD